MNNHPWGISLVALFIVALAILVIWDGIWKVIAMWKSARHNQLGWFICLAVFNTAGSSANSLSYGLPETRSAQGLSGRLKRARESNIPEISRSPRPSGQTPPVA
jgi:predicted permease